MDAIFERNAIQKKLNTLQNKGFGCEDAVYKAIDALTKTWKYHQLQLTLHTEKRYTQPGRPTDDAPFETVWRFEGDLREHEELHCL